MMEETTTTLDLDRQWDRATRLIEAATGDPYGDGECEEIECLEMLEG